MAVEHRYFNNILIIELDNEDAIIQYNMDKFIEDTMSLYKSGKVIALDMSKKSYLNSTGLGELIKMKDNLFDNDINLVLINPSDRVKSLLSMVGVDQFFKIITDENQL